MATNTVFPTTRTVDQTDPSVGLAVLALLLALILGFSAADIQRERTVNSPVSSGDADAGILDGRGKWGGYL
ncbi:MAG: hypothetical protein AAF543_13405 [Pseudomonadota bacterium]